MLQADKAQINTSRYCNQNEWMAFTIIKQWLFLSWFCAPSGATLVFLPGYDDIVTLRDMLLEDETFGDSSLFQVYTLHSSMQSQDQKKVFRTPAPGVRKIVSLYFIFKWM